MSHRQGITCSPFVEGGLVGGVWPVGPLVLVQGDDDPLQVVKGQVDVLGLGQLLPVDASLRHALRPCQVHQVKLGPGEKEK